MIPADNTHHHVSFIASLYYLWIFDSVVMRFLIFMAITLFLSTLYISSFV